MQMLRYGERGLFVTYLQLALERAGLQAGEKDGIFGWRTLRAVEQFQSQNGLAADGIVGRLTWAALFPYLTGYTVTIRDGQETVTPLPFRVVAADVPYSSFLTGCVLDGLLARYPFLAMETVGVSVMGRPIDTVTMGSGARIVGVNAAHHANEWITTPLVLLYLEAYAEAYQSGGTINGVPAAALFSRATLSLTPLVNPDGVDLVTGAIGQDDSYYAQAKALASFYPDIPFPSGWKANIRGIDLNLQYPAGWEQAREIKFAQGYTRPGPRDYVGGKPLEAPESEAMVALTRRQDYALTVSYHTQGEEIYWQFLNLAPAGAEELANRFAEVSGYAVANVPYASGFAGYKDWFIEAFGKRGYTIEAGRGVNPLPIEDLPALFAQNSGILTEALLHA